MKATDEKNKSAITTKRSARRTPHKNEELKTEPPISEKDEVKHAEQKLRKNTGR